MDISSKLRLVAGAACVSLSLAACSSGSAGGSDAGTSAGGTVTFTPKAKGLKVGVSNGFVDSTWRTQMLENLNQVADEYKADGLVDSITVASANVDVNGQIRQIRDLISAGMDIIIVDPNSPSALDGVFKQAADRGILVVAVDQAVTAPTALNVVIDQQAWAESSATWMSDQLGGSGKIVAINGVAGAPANEARVAGFESVFSADNGIDVVNAVNADWDEVKGQQTATNLLTSTPDLDGIWVQDGMAQGVVQAVSESQPATFPLITGEYSAGYLRLWSKLKADQNFSSFAQVNPNGIAASALRVAIAAEQGKTLKDESLTDGHTVIVPLPEAITDDNLADYVTEVSDKPDTYWITNILTQDEADGFFN